MRTARIAILLIGLAALIAACGSAATPTAPSAAAGRTLTVMTHDSFDVSEEVVAAFEERCHCRVQFLKSGDAGLMLNQAILSRDNPLADVMYGVDNTF
ncbi:MAG TPA: thiamine ABC transporter substrate-binding protein, partial [Anaerolineae bacterium]|nr:thiamine ABC transporter substrate-binding protein [Anaerolineae bacterium]